MFDSQPGRASLQYSMLLEFLNFNVEKVCPEFRAFILHARDEGISGPPLLALANAMIEQGYSLREVPSYWLSALRNIIARSEYDAQHFDRMHNHGFGHG